MILICYDGSSDAQCAVDSAAQLMPGAAATVLSVWEEYIDMITRNGAIGLGFGLTGAAADGEDIDAASRKAALAIARDGADRASAAGLVAEPRIASRHAGTSFTILAVATEIDAGVVVLGTRGRGGVTSYLLGSVSHEVMQHADRPVLVVPSPALCEHRRGWARHAGASAGIV